MAAEVNVSSRVHVPCGSIVEQLVGYEVITLQWRSACSYTPVHSSSVTEQLVGLWLLTSFFLAELKGYTGARQQCI